MTKAASVIAVMAEQPDGTASATAADQYSTMLAEIGGDPFNAEALDVTVAAHDLQRGSGKAQIGEIGIFQADIGFVDLAVIARDDMAQVMDTN